MNVEYKRIENQTKKKLIDLDYTLADLARAMNISQALLWKHMAGKTKGITPEILTGMINEGISKL